ncbi:MAG TPA: porin, partial [Candidatus Cybelea sp.]|nr:porin [Candidatus Cybelea sp.]
MCNEHDTHAKGSENTMKHILYGTTALVAAGLLATAGAPSAQAAEQPIQITIGGYFYAFFNVTQSGNPNARDFISTEGQPGSVAKVGVPGLGGVPATGLANRGIRDKSRIQFDGRTQLDNGLVAGLRVQLRGNNSDSQTQLNNNSSAEIRGPQSEDQADEHFLYLDSATYGRLEAGATASAPRKMWYGAVTPAMPYHGLMSPNFIELPGITFGAKINQPSTLVTMGGQTDRAEKIAYYTPRIAGFQLGASYAPDQCNQNDTTGNPVGSVLFTTGLSIANIPGGQTTLQCHFIGGNDMHNVPGNMKNIWSGAVNYVNKFGDVDVGIYVGGEHGSLEAQANADIFGTSTNLKDRTQIGAGFRVSWMGWTAGFSALTDNNGEKGGFAAASQLGVGAADKARRNDFHGGLAYTMGPWSLGGSIAY